MCPLVRLHDLIAGLVVLAGMGSALASGAQEQPNSLPPQQPAPRAKAPLVIPQPKALSLGAGVFRLPPNSSWVLRAATRDDGLWQAAQSVLGGNSGSFQTATEWVALELSASAKAKIPRTPVSPRWASDPEGYLLAVETNGVVILARTAQGAFYGLQTLAQLWQQAGEERACPVLEIEDWPAMRFRGVHWFPSASGVPMHQKLIRDVFGAFKFNQSVIQCEAAQWDSHPEITAPNAISKADLRQLVVACRSCFQEPIPLINVPGHAEWVFRNGSNLDFAEDRRTPYAYCVNNPQSFAFVQDVLNECLPIFQSKYCHLGHDEVAMRGRFPNPECPRCKDATATELVLKHVAGMNDWLNTRGVETMIWGDMLLGPSEARDAMSAKTVTDAQARRAGISKKVTIVDWHYAAAADARSLEVLQKDGFRVIAASWYTPANIQHLAKAALDTKAEGLLQTTWMGYFPDESAMKTQLQQFTAFVLAAEYAWSGRNEAPSELGYDPKEVFLKAYGRGGIK
jgi:hexosaminidase